MGVNLRSLIPEGAVEIIDIESLKGKTLAIDAYNALYQFLAIIRQPNGTPLKDSRGRITSHLSGLFYRTVNFLELGIKPVYVFDGTPPEIKELEILRRKKIKEEAAIKYEEALRRGDLEEARTYAQQTATLTEEMVNDAKKLLNALGVPWVQAPSEGEAQAAYMAQKGDVWAAASQDYDSLLFGAPRLVRNLTISGRRKLPRRKEYIEINPEVIYLNKLLEALNITREQLIDIAILIGTDYNPDGVKGVGPKTALKLIRIHGNLKKILRELKNAHFPINPEEIKKIFLEPKVSGNYKLKWKEPNENAVIELLCEEHDFSLERVKKAIERAIKAYREHMKQVSLEKWFKLG
ncbi:MAG: flap endonuclease-1 [Candidatus Methanomethylicota archaeon]|uniref:Flap endonuclease 1 n=1 Tax=Thermoproteota archaeon TaxID=2056631 RepID=A0A497EUN3_9CREN|nr:MAG: flap endonuclease-1 [Candidatus Verstraetearchaeota archaeon]